MKSYGSEAMKKLLKLLIITYCFNVAHAQNINNQISFQENSMMNSPRESLDNMFYNNAYNYTQFNKNEINHISNAYSNGAYFDESIEQRIYAFRSINGQDIAFQLQNNFNHWNLVQTYLNQKPFNFKINNINSNSHHNNFIDIVGIWNKKYKNMAIDFPGKFGNLLSKSSTLSNVYPVGSNISYEFVLNYRRLNNQGISGWVASSYSSSPGKIINKQAKPTPKKESIDLSQYIPSVESFVKRIKNRNKKPNLTRFICDNKGKFFRIALESNDIKSIEIFNNQQKNIVTFFGFNNQIGNRLDLNNCETTFSYNAGKLNTGDDFILIRANLPIFEIKSGATKKGVYYDFYY